MRKAKKEEQLQKRRNILLTELDEISPLKEKNISQSQDNLNYDDIVNNMRSSDADVCFSAVHSCRLALSKANNPPINEFCKRGAVKLLGNQLNSKV